MILEIFSVLDVKTGAYLEPIFMQNEAVVLRALRNTLENPDHPFAQNPEDFTLFHIGTWDNVAAQIVQLDKIKPIAPLLALKESINIQKSDTLQAVENG